MAQFFEALMLIAFGFSWPISIIKTLRVKKVSGKSPLFMSLIIGGYICGIIAKCISDQLTPVVALYILNTIMVGIDLILYLHFSNKEERH